MIQKISFGELPQVNNLPQKQNKVTDASLSDKKENASMPKNTMFGLAALGALALGGIYYAATRGHNSSELTKAASETLNNAVDSPIVDKEISKVKMNEEAQKS